MLNGLVRSFWTARGAAENAVLPGIVAPDSHVEFVFHLGDPWLTRRSGESGWTLQPAAFVYAQHQRALQFQGSGKVEMIAFRTSPVVAAAIFGHPVSGLWDRAVPLTELIGSQADMLLERVARTPVPDRPKMMEDWLARRLADWDSGDGRAERLFDALMWRCRTQTMAEVAKSLGPSSRSMRRLFAAHVGLSPKSVQLSGRILTGCSLLRERPDMQVTEVADRAGFYDHAAFTHAFTETVGISPMRFRSEPFAFYERGPPPSR